MDDYSYTMVWVLMNRSKKERSRQKLAASEVKRFGGGYCIPRITELELDGLKCDPDVWPMEDPKDDPPDPMDPTEPTEPVEPREPIEPMVPADPTEPREPAEPIDPTDPAVDPKAEPL